MINIKKQISYWLSSADEDLEAARELITHGKTRHGLFFAHLCLEKTLKAHVCLASKDLAPPIHNLPRLAKLGELKLTSEFSDLLAEMNSFNIEGRYPELSLPIPKQAEAERYLTKAEELQKWLKKLF